MSNITIIGGGPAGLMAAEVAAQAGHSVTVFERKPTLGRKFMMAGRGGLNLTHSEPLEQFITRYGNAADWLKPCIEAFPPTALREWCEGLEQETFVGSSGRVFPKALKASPLLRAWIARLTSLGVQFKMQHEWQGWDSNGALLFNGAPFKADKTVLALGGASWPKLGSDGSWAELLKARGVELAPFQPANCGFLVKWTDLFTTRYAGQPLKPVTLSLGDKSVQGEIMITSQGIEGGAVYALSSRIREAINKHGHATLHLDLRPGLGLEELTRRLADGRGSQSFSTYLKKAAGLSPIAASLLHEVTPPDKRSHLHGMALAQQIKALPVTTHHPASIERAISSAGGIKRNAVDENFMLKALPGVYAVGEMLDWEAPTGGYLLQASFSSAIWSARSFA